MLLLIPKMGLLYGYSVGGYRYCVGNLFWFGFLNASSGDSLRFFKDYYRFLSRERFMALLIPWHADAWTGLLVREASEHPYNMLQFHVQIRTSRISYLGPWSMGPLMLNGPVDVETHRQWVGRNAASRNRPCLVRDFFLTLTTVTLLFVFDNYCPTID